jgi:hypothetical protein
MAVLWAAVRRGIKKPLSIASRSRTALGSGVDVPIPILSCAIRLAAEKKEKVNRRSNRLFIFDLSWL